MKVHHGEQNGGRHDGRARFRPLPLLGSAHLQTIVGRFAWHAEPPSTFDQVELSDGDRLSVVTSASAGWGGVERTVVLVHGLCGCYRSAYMSRMAGRLVARGHRVVRVNLRGCGSGVGLARHPYHSGRSEDVRRVIEWLAERTPDSPVTLVGFSLGGNIVLKMAGEDGDRPTGTLDSVIAVSAPIDLMACSRLIEQPRNRAYDRYFVRRLRADIAEKHRRFPDLPAPDLPRHLTLRRFDDLYTAPRSGFRDAVDYYTRASSEPLIDRIEPPALLLSSRDDPFIAAGAFERIRPKANLEVCLTDRGGHLGFLGFTARPWDFRWMDELLENWIARR